MFRITAGTVIIALLAVLLGTLGALEVRRRMTPTAQSVVAAQQETRFVVPVAARDLEKDRPITDGDVGLISLTQKEFSERQFPKDYMNNARQIIGRVLRDRLPKGASFQPENFFSDRMGVTLSDRVKPGFRAVSIEVDTDGVLDGHVVPGAMVDIVFRNDKATLNRAVGTLTVLSDVEILAIGDNSVPGFRGGFKPEDNETTVVLAVPVEKANILKVVDGRGTLSLLVRGKDDRDVIASPKATTLEELMGVRPEKGPFMSQIYRRGRPSTLVFDNQQMVVDDRGGGINATTVQPPVAAPPRQP